MPAITEEPKVAESKTFYCKSPHYAACVNPGKEVLEGGVKSRFGEKQLEFTPTAGPDRKTYGVIRTDDAEKIAFIEREIALGNPDFMTIEMFMEHTIPDKQKVETLRQQEEGLRRELGVRNQLLEDLAKSNPDLYNQLLKKHGVKR